MTTHTGDEGVVKVGSDAVAEVLDFEFTITHAFIEDPAKGDPAVTGKAGRERSSGRIKCMWDQSDTTGQVAMVSGASVTINCFVEGDTSGDIQYSFPAILGEETHRSTEGESIAEAEFAWTSNGAHTRSAVV